MALITIEQAWRHLRITTSGSPAAGPDDDDLRDKMDQASEIVIDYIKRPDHGWSLTSSPPSLPPALVQAAILLVLTALYDDRSGTGGGDYLSPDGPVARLLWRYRDPALA